MLISGIYRERAGECDQLAEKKPEERKRLESCRNLAPAGKGCRRPFSGREEESTTKTGSLPTFGASALFSCPNGWLDTRAASTRRLTSSTLAAWTLAQAVCGSAGSQGAATDVSSCAIAKENGPIAANSAPCGAIEVFFGQWAKD